jgi:acetyltransferase
VPRRDTVLEEKIGSPMTLIHADDDLPRAVARPYPSQYISRWIAKDGAEILFRPIRPEDEPLMLKFHETLSDESVHLRYFHMEKLDTRVAHERLMRKCFIDYSQEMALVAERTAPETGEREILAVGRLSKSQNAKKAEVAVLVSDHYQGKGLGTELLRRLIEVAGQEKLEEIVAHILLENFAMRALADRFGFKLRKSDDAEMVVAVLTL